MVERKNVFADKKKDKALHYTQVLLIQLCYLSINAHTFWYKFGLRKKKIKFCVLFCSLEILVHKRTWPTNEKKKEELIKRPGKKEDFWTLRDAKKFSGWGSGVDLLSTLMLNRPRLNWACVCVRLSKKLMKKKQQVEFRKKKSEVAKKRKFSAEDSSRFFKNSQSQASRTSPHFILIFIHHLTDWWWWWLLISRSWPWFVSVCSIFAIISRLSTLFSSFLKCKWLIGVHILVKMLKGVVLPFLLSFVGSSVCSSGRQTDLPSVLIASGHCRNIFSQVYHFFGQMVSCALALSHANTSSIRTDHARRFFLTSFFKILSFLFSKIVFICFVHFRRRTFPISDVLNQVSHTHTHKLTSIFELCLLKSLLTFFSQRLQSQFDCTCCTLLDFFSSTYLFLISPYKVNLF